METQFNCPILVCSNIEEFHSNLFRYLVENIDFRFSYISSLQELISTAEYKPNQIYNIRFNGRSYPVILKEHDNWVKTSIIEH